MNAVAKNRPATEQVEEMPEALRVYCWRHEELMRAGYPIVAATRIASRTDVDLHRAVALLQRGCSVEWALRILL